MVNKQDGYLKLSTLDWKAPNLSSPSKTILELNEGQKISNYSESLLIVNVNGM